MIPLNDPERFAKLHSEELRSAFEDVLRSGIYILGPQNEMFSQSMKSYLDIQHCCPVGNGTDALEIALRAAGIQRGDLVVTVSNAGGYTPTAINQLGAKPIYVDVEFPSLQMCPSSLESTLESLENSPGAIVVTHLYGKAAPIEKIIEVANRFGVPVIEDCAQSLGAEVNGRKLGTFGLAATTSFYPTKNLGALGDGGAIFTDNEEFARRCEMLRQYGWHSRYDTSIPGGRNSRLDEFQAAFLRIGLVHLDQRNERRREIHSYFGQFCGDVSLPIHKAERDFVAHLFILAVTDRERAKASLNKKGIATGHHYPNPDHLNPIFSSPLVSHLVVTESAVKKIMTLPMFPELTDSEVEVVGSALSDLNSENTLNYGN